MPEQPPVTVSLESPGAELARLRAENATPAALIEQLPQRLQQLEARVIPVLRVPSDNNLAERTIRMPKLKQKVSGCVRSTGGAQAFATVRSYLATLHKQSVDTYQALVMTFQGHPPMPQLG